jgi:hypothetical protein
MMLLFWVWRRVYSFVDANVSEKPTVSIFRAEDLDIFSPEDGDSMFLRNVRIYRRVYAAPKPRTATSPIK